MKLTAVCILGLLGLCSAVAPLNLKFEWKVMDYAYPDENSRESAIKDGSFIPENNLPDGMDIWRNKMFISVPRWFKGIPSSLNYVLLDGDSQSPKLNPYPDFSTNQEGNCNGITMTYRMRVDECDRLWVMDHGSVGIGNTTQQLCPFALHAFDLKNDKHILKYEYKPEDAKAGSFIANIVIDVGETCDDTYVYATDEWEYGLIVYSLKDNDSWRFEHEFFYPDPLKGEFHVDGMSFHWKEDGILGMALSPKKENRVLFFHPLASEMEFMVPTSVLRQKPNADSYQMFVKLDERNGHSMSETMSEDGILIFSLIEDNAVGCWNMKKPFRKSNHAVLAKDDVGLIFPSDVRVDRDNNLWIISDRMHVHLFSKLDFNEVNFRVYYTPLKDAIAGTVCDHDS